MSRIRANTIVNGAGTGAPNFPRGAIIGGISAINAEISLGTGTSISSPATNELALGTNDAERLRIDSGGNVGVGTDNPFSANGTNLEIYSTSSSRLWLTSSNKKQYYIESNSGSGALNFTNQSDGTSVVTMESNGAVSTASTITITDGNLVVASGHGIDFSATGDGSGTSTSELLDDYEEGTWSPAIIKVLSNPSVSYSVREGTYTKVGRIVTVFFDVTASITGGSGAARIGDLPFTVSSSMAGFSRIHFRDSSAVTAGGATDQLTGYAQKGNTYLGLERNSSGASGYGYSAAADWNSSGRVTGYVTYEV